MAATLVISTITNISLLSDISRLEKKTDKVLDDIKRSQLIATLYVLRDPNKQFTKIKEELKMKNKKNRLGGKISNRTKVIGGVTILLCIGAAISVVADNNEISKIEELEEIVVGPEQLTDYATEIAEF